MVLPKSFSPFYINLLEIDLLSFYQFFLIDFGTCSSLKINVLQRENRGLRGVKPRFGGSLIR